MSGLLEFLMALVAMLYWYSYSVTTWVARALDAALEGKMGSGATDQAMGFMALVIFATHPLTWLLAYLGVEGNVRLVGAAFAETNLGILPLFVLDKILLKITGQSAPGIAESAGYTEGNWSSFAQAIREKVRASTSRVLPDEMCVSTEGAEQFLEVRACRRKPDWTPPRIVKYQHRFYRLEACVDGRGPRRFRYRLRRLAAGVMSRTVLEYSPDPEPVLVDK